MEHQMLEAIHACGATMTRVKIHPGDYYNPRTLANRIVAARSGATACRGEDFMLVVPAKTGWSSLVH